MNYDTELKIGGRSLAIDQPTYFIADIAANHDGDLQRARDLIRRAKNAGAHAAKFQHFFDAPKIVSDYGFRNLGGAKTHQAKWDRPVFEVYEQYSINNDWNHVWETAREVGIDWMTTPYDRELTDRVVDLLPAFKIGSGDITWLELIQHIASKGKPVLLDGSVRPVRGRGGGQCVPRGQPPALPASMQHQLHRRAGKF